MIHDIQLPQVNQVSGEGSQAVFSIEPLLPGYGMTLGNSMRRVLLGSLLGAAVTAVKIDGVSHEFSTIPGVVEDVVEIILNLKLLRLKLHDEGPVTLLLNKSGAGPVTASDIKTSSNVEVVNPELVICTIDSAKGKVSMEIRAEKGRGYVPVEKRESEKLEVGMIAIDAIYTPVIKVRYNVENTRVGQMTDLDRLLLDVTTDGSISPDEAVKQASQILVDHFQLLTGEKPPVAEAAITARGGRKSEDASQILIEELNLSPRTTNALINNDLRTMEDIVRLTDSELKNLKGFGSKAYDEVKERVAELGLRMTEEE
jgi:DNA-directed RNA polymerase subunit alpha